MELSISQERRSRGMEALRQLSSSSRVSSPRKLAPCSLSFGNSLAQENISQSTSQKSNRKRGVSRTGMSFPLTSTTFAPMIRAQR
jgi:hypothetical protein